MYFKGIPGRLCKTQGHIWREYEGECLDCGATYGKNLRGRFFIKQRVVSEEEFRKFEELLDSKLGRLLCE